MRVLRSLLHRVPPVGFPLQMDSNNFLNLVPIIHHIPSRNAGHSKWANIKHTKQAKDMERSKTLIKYHNKISVAIREGGSPDPKVNQKLNYVLQEAKDHKLPMGSIQKLLERAAKSKSEGFSEVWAAKGPGKVLMLVEIYTENRKKLKDDLNIVFKKARGTWIENTALHQFQHVGLIHCSEFEGKPLGEEFLETATEHAIEAGADDVSVIEDPDHGVVLEFTTSPSAFSNVKSRLSDAGYKVVYSETIYAPLSFVELTEDEFRYSTTLYERIMEHPEVVNVYTNMAH